MNDTLAAVCDVCPRHCHLTDGAIGFCRARIAKGGHVVSANYGQITSIALDPIEKKPLDFFHPGENILSVGAYGCNMRCPFCQNDSISQHGRDELQWQTATPSELADLALRLKGEHRNIGLAYTYNEPLVGWEFVRDCAKEIKARRMCNVLVSNGCATENVIAELAPLMDAANIDIKGPSQEYYDWLGGDFNAVCRTIRMLHDAGCHVEATTLIVPGRNDSDADMESITGFIASVSPDIPFHVTRFFPRWRMSDASPTPISTIRRLADIAKRHLNHVLTGNC